MPSHTRIIERILLALVFSTLAFPQSHPNFSGTWKLNVSASDYTDRRVAVPDSLIWKIEQRGDRLTYTVEGARQGKKTGFTAEFDIGGGSFESDEAGIITARWKGTALTVGTLYNPDNERRSSMEEVWALSDDGRTLTDTVVFHMPKTAKNQVDALFKRVFEKQ
jgi:hypothetical protein